MKKVGPSVVLVILAFCFACSRNASSGATLKEKVVVTEYTEFNTHSVELVYNPNDRSLELRIRFSKGDDHMMYEDDELDFLKKEVQRLTSSNQRQQLGMSGYTFQFMAGNPIWGPFNLMDADHNYSCLIFAVQAVVDGTAISAYGTPEVLGFNGYTSWEPKYHFRPAD